jgi:hypothetical protein
MTRTIELRYTSYDEPETTLTEPQPQTVTYEFQVPDNISPDTLYLHFERFCTAIGVEI